jgi:hypothetical protein
MRKLAFSLLSVFSLSLINLRAGDQPRGSVLELHSCELYAGGCVVSSEEPMDGRQMLSIWTFAGGGFAGSQLSGLQLAVLQSSSENLAAAGTKSGDAVAYLPSSATSEQRAALLAWLKASQPEFKPAHLQTRVVAFQSSKSASGLTFAAGDFVSVKTAPIESCETGACGEALWYSPRATTTIFTVAVDKASTITEPMLKLKWRDAGKRSIFLAKFGEETPAKNIYVTAADFCETAGKLF